MFGPDVTEAQLPYTSALGGDVSQEEINSRKPKQQRKTNFTSAIGAEIEYIEKIIQKPSPTSELVIITSALQGSTHSISVDGKVKSPRVSVVSSAPSIVKQPGPSLPLYPKQKPKKPVTFAPNTKPPQPFRPTTIGYEVPPKRNATKFGKANLARDIPIFVVIISLLFGASIMLGGTSTEPLGLDGKKERLEGLKERLEEALSLKIERYNNRAVDCNLFLADSTIPGAGLSLFSGRQFFASDTVLESSLAFKLLNKSTDLVDYGLILKHHPVFANLNGGIWKESGNRSIVLTASKEILPGQELFLSFEDHPASTFQSQLFMNIPRPEHYDLADAILMDEIKSHIGKHQRNGQQNSFGGTGALKLVQRTVARLIPGVAQLLPSHTATLDRLRLSGVPPVAYSMMQNRTLEWLQINGRCIDLTERNAEGTLIARKSIKKSAMISIMPLFATDVDPRCSPDDESCSDGPLCFGHARSIVRLCAMSVVAHLSITNDPSKANAEYQWSKWNMGNSDSHGRDPVRLLSETANKLTFDIFATKPIEEREEIVLYVGEIAVTDFVPVHRGMFPENWLEVTIEEQNIQKAKSKTMTNETEPVSAEL